MENLILEKVKLDKSEERNKVNSFLEGFGLILDLDVDYTIVLKNNKGEIKATCSSARNVFKCFAVSEELRGENVTSQLINNLIDTAFEKGIYHNFIFTKPDKKAIFLSLGFKVIHEVKDVVLLEQGIYDINKALDKMAKKFGINDISQKFALVMNCNPFTLGHRYLIEEAAKQNNEVIVFIVEEDKSLFPFKTRYDLVRKGTGDLKNVKIVPGGEYIISRVTFPSYFLRKEDERLKAYSELDAGIFGKYFCKKFNIKKRFVGEEPYCKVTACYNSALMNVLPQYGVELNVVIRKAYEDGFISASKVRNLIKQGKFQGLEHLLPKTTMEFLKSEEGKAIMEKIKNSNSPH